MPLSGIVDVIAFSTTIALATIIIPVKHLALSVPSCKRGWRAFPVFDHGILSRHLTLPCLRVTDCNQIGAPPGSGDIPVGRWKPETHGPHRPVYDSSFVPDFVEWRKSQPYPFYDPQKLAGGDRVRRFLSEMVANVVNGYI
jgi:hypothetical protein